MRSAAVGLSGGVDSAVCACLLKEAGYAVHGVSLLMHGEGDSTRAQAVADTLGIPFDVYDVRNEFLRAVIGNFKEEYRIGNTPNPCIMCNRTVKFPSLLAFADAHGLSHIATGHYARVKKCGSRCTVSRAKDTAKDQTYMLSSMPQNILERLILPLGEYTKAEIRALAEERGLPVAHAKDSQDICFIPDGDYTAFLTKEGVPLPDGVFADEEGNILAPSKNQACYTVGQRRGLGYAAGHHMFVTARDAENNRTILSPRSPSAKTVFAERLNYLAAEPGDLDAPVSLTAKIRYTQQAYPCEAYTDGEMLTVRFADPLLAPSAGQSVVLYDGDDVVLGGIITDWSRE